MRYKRLGLSSMRNAVRKCLEGEFNAETATKIRVSFRIFGYEFLKRKTKNIWPGNNCFLLLFGAMCESWPRQIWNPWKRRDYVQHETAYDRCSKNLSMHRAPWTPFRLFISTMINCSARECCPMAVVVFSRIDDNRGRRRGTEKKMQCSERETHCMAFHSIRWWNLCEKFNLFSSLSEFLELGLLCPAAIYVSTLCALTWRFEAVE